MAREIAGIRLEDGDAFDGYANWVGSEDLKNGYMLGVIAEPSDGGRYRFAENKNVVQTIYRIELRDSDHELALSSGKIDLALQELNKEKAEWVIGIIRKLLLPEKIQAELAKTDWVISRLAEPYPPDMHNQLDEEE